MITVPRCSRYGCPSEARWERSDTRTALCSAHAAPWAGDVILTPLEAVLCRTRHATRSGQLVHYRSTLEEVA